MLRPELLQSLLAALASQRSRAPQSKPPARGRGHALFPVAGAACTCEPEWAQFPAAGFSKPACGVVYNRRFRPENGLPLGAIDTGRLDLQADGTLGYCTIFNSICPQRGPLNLPFLGFTAGEQLWVLSDLRDNFGAMMWSNIQTPTDIDYWDYYPVADLEFQTPCCPVSPGLRAWVPFLPGDSAHNNTPGAVFELTLRNVSSAPQRGRVAISFPGPTQPEAQISAHSPREKITKPIYSWVATAPEPTRAVRENMRGEFSGIVVSSEKVKEIGYALGIADDRECEMGAALSREDAPTSGRAWANLAARLPEAKPNDFGASVSVAYELAPGEETTNPFVLAWFAPMWIGEGPHTFTHMYATRYENALAVARFLSRERASLLGRILAWQEAIYADERMPAWLRDSLVNILHLFAMNSLWAAARPPIGPWYRPEDGLFGLLDGIVEDPAIEPIPDSFYANAPLVFFFPDLALSTLRGYKAYQFLNGAAVWIFGGVVGQSKGGYEMTAGTEFAMPTPGYQTTTNGPCYVDLVDRYLLRTGDHNALQEFYLWLKKNTAYTMSLWAEDGADGIISVPTGKVDPARTTDKPGYHLEWFENILFFGMTSHVGGIHLANLRMSERMAERASDAEFASQCRNWFQQGRGSMENKMWAGKYYLNYFEPATGRKSDDIFAYQLDGQWMARFHGLPGVFRSERVKTALDTIRRTCARLTEYGAVNVARPDGTLAQGVGYGPNAFFVPELYMLAMTYMYEGIVSSGSSWPAAWCTISRSTPARSGTSRTSSAATRATGCSAATTSRT